LIARLLSSVVSFPHMHHQKYRVSINNWYTFRDKIWGNYKAYIHVTCISGKLNSQRFQNWRYTSILPISTNRLHNFHKRHLP
jgi:hypothetical protein